MKKLTKIRVMNLANLTAQLIGLRFLYKKRPLWLAILITVMAIAMCIPVYLVINPVVAMMSSDEEFSEILSEIELDNYVLIEKMKA